MVVFHTNMGSVVVRSSQVRFFPKNPGLLCSVPRRDVFLFTCIYVHFLKKGHIQSTSVIYGPNFVRFHNVCILQS